MNKLTVNAPPQPQTDTYRQIENDGWIEWGGNIPGGEEPVIGSATVEVKFRNGESGVGKARSLYWPHDGCISDIIAYRVIENDGREG